MLIWICFKKKIIPRKKRLYNMCISNCILCTSNTYFHELYCYIYLSFWISCISIYITLIILWIYIDMHDTQEITRYAEWYTIIYVEIYMRYIDGVVFPRVSIWNISSIRLKLSSNSLKIDIKFLKIIPLKFFTNWDNQ